MMYAHSILKNLAAFVTFHPLLLKDRLFLFLESKQRSLVKSFACVQSSSTAASKTAGVFETIKLQFSAQESFKDYVCQ